jgi:hypothetical protein
MKDLLLTVQFTKKKRGGANGRGNMLWLLIIPPALAGMYFGRIVLNTLLRMEMERDIQCLREMSEDELRAELANDGETIESVRARFENVQTLGIIGSLINKLS